MFKLGHPFTYLLPYIAVLYIRPHEYVSWLIGVPILPILLMLSVLVWLAQPEKRCDSPQHRLMPVLYFILVFSVLITGWMSGALKALTDFLPTVLLFFVLSTAIDSTQRLRTLFMLISAAGAVMALHGINQMGTEDGIGWTGAQMIQGRITYLGFLNDPNDLAMVLLMGLPMALYVANTARIFLVKWTYRAAAALAIYGVYLTNSRGGVLSLGAMMLAYCIMRFGLWRGLLVLPVFVSALVVLGPSRGGEISADEESAAGRVEAWFEGFQMLQSHPLFGVGYNNFLEHHVRTAHNSFVLAIAELGIIGYYVWLSNMVLTVAMLVRIERTKQLAPHGKPADPTNWQEVHSISRVLLYGMIGGLVSSMFLSRSYTVVWYVHIGMVVAVFQLARRLWPTIEPITFKAWSGRLFVASNGSIVLLWVLTRLLL